MQEKHEGKTDGRPSCRRLRIGFSTGTAMTAAARAALRAILTGTKPSCIAVRLPVGYYLAVPTTVTCLNMTEAQAVVIKDAGDDPDVTDKTPVVVRLELLKPYRTNGKLPTAEKQDFKPGHGLAYIVLSTGGGVGVVTKPGLPVAVGEPAINPTPRAMLVENLSEELNRSSDLERFSTPEVFPAGSVIDADKSSEGTVRLPLPVVPQPLCALTIHVRVSMPQGEHLAPRTLNPRLGILGGLSILGTTGLVKPLSHEAYEETILSAFHVAKAAGSSTVVLSTGGKSEKLARGLLQHEPTEAFVQIADFFAFAVDRAAHMGFSTIVHSVFFGKAVKMASGKPSTHAHKSGMDLNTLVRCGERVGASRSLLDQMIHANTARHALEMLRDAQAHDVVLEVAREALRHSRRFAGTSVPRLRLLLFDYDGSLLADVEDQEAATPPKGS
ncbi:MAG: cobalt-precorrin-5B (C(1))-methyltransferase CbiD [Desulfosoma sp.]